ncbi:hypothetical protein KM043_008124 [Ampulex compressa]|nr:hypothetical protein KM043_008124 [Ampulex compressa]
MGNSVSDFIRLTIPPLSSGSEQIYRFILSLLKSEVCVAVYGGSRGVAQPIVWSYDNKTQGKNRRSRLVGLMCAKRLTPGQIPQSAVGRSGSPRSELVSRKNPPDNGPANYLVRLGFSHGRRRSRWMIASGGQRPIRVSARSTRGFLLLKNGPLCLAVYGGRDLAGLPSTDSPPWEGVVGPEEGGGGAWNP